MLASLLGMLPLLAACVLVRLNDDNRLFYASTVLVGRVHAEDATAPLTVFAARDSGERTVEHEVFLHEPGGYELIVADGRYWIGAFEDRDADGRPGPGEPAGMYPTTVEVDRAGLITGLDMQFAALEGDTVAKLLPDRWRNARAHSTQVGARADLSSQAFSAEAGRTAYWTPLQSFKVSGGNLYALAEVDPDKIPIVLIHGAQGSAQDWRYFAQRFAATRFQPFIFQYPSGAPVGSMADLLYWKLVNLGLRYGYGEIHIVAHSLGGLVVQRLLEDHGSELPQVRSVVTLATPWWGVRSASLGVQHSPAVVPSWRDLDPNGSFVAELFVRPIPAQARHLLIYTSRDASGWWGPAETDGTVTLESQLRIEALQQAARVLMIPTDHAGVLSSDRAFEAALAWVSEAHDPQEGALQMDVRYVDDRRAAMGLIPAVVLRREPQGSEPRTTIHAVDLAADEATVRGVPEGRYASSLVVPGFRSVPRRHDVTVHAGQITQVNVVVEPQGTLIGRVVDAVDPVQRPAGSLKSIETGVVTALRLEGNGELRRLKPAGSDSGGWLSAYADGRDYAAGSAFCFTGLEPGDYRLTVELGDGGEFTTIQTVEAGNSVERVIVRIPDARESDVRR